MKTTWTMTRQRLKDKEKILDNLDNLDKKEFEEKVKEY
jgi:hypothetical protein